MLPSPQSLSILRTSIGSFDETCATKSSASVSIFVLAESKLSKSIVIMLTMEQEVVNQLEGTDLPPADPASFALSQFSDISLGRPFHDSLINVQF